MALVKKLTRSDFPDLVMKALRAKGGGAHLTIVAKYIWDKYRDDLGESGSLLYTWQYDMRWAATKLRHQGKLKAVSASPRGVWELSSGSER